MDLDEDSLEKLKQANPVSLEAARVTRTLSFDSPEDYREFRAWMSGPGDVLVSADPALLPDQFRLDIPGHHIHVSPDVFLELDDFSASTVESVLAN